MRKHARRKANTSGRMMVFRNGCGCATCTLNSLSGNARLYNQMPVINTSRPGNTHHGPWRSISAPRAVTLIINPMEPHRRTRP